MKDAYNSREISTPWIKPLRILYEHLYRIGAAEFSKDAVDAVMIRGIQVLPRADAVHHLFRESAGGCQPKLNIRGFKAGFLAFPSQRVCGALQFVDVLDVHLGSSVFALTEPDAVAAALLAEDIEYWENVRE